MIQLPSNALLPELGQASLAVTLVGSSVANQFASASQASAFNAEVLDYNCLVFVYMDRKRICRASAVYRIILLYLSGKDCVNVTG